MKCNMQKAFAEVNEILLHSDKEVQDKIPNKFKLIIRNNMDVNWKLEIDPSKNINEQQLLKETREILAVIYRDYLCSEQERNELIEKNRLKLIEAHNKEQQLFYQTYDNSKMFSEKKLVGVEEPKNILPIESKKKKWYEKIFEWLRINYR